MEFSIYFLSPDRRFVEGAKTFPEGLSRARQLSQQSTDSRGQKIDSVEVWDNNTQQPVYGVTRKHGNSRGGPYEELFREGYSETA